MRTALYSIFAGALLGAVACSKGANNNNTGLAGTSAIGVSGAGVGVSGTGVLGTSGTMSSTAVAGTTPLGTAGTMPLGTAGTLGTSGTGAMTMGTAGRGTGGTMGMAGMAAAGTGAAGTSAAGAGGAAGGAGGTSAAGAGGGAAGTGGGGGTTLTGTLGPLGAAQMPVNAYATTNGIELLIYITTAPLTCQMMNTMGGPSWLGTLPMSSQVVELVIPMFLGPPMMGMNSGEVNYVQGGTSSNQEHPGMGTITLTTLMPMMLYEGSFTGNGIMGTFHAVWCQGGAEY